MSPARVAVVGAGMAGPVLAIFLKSKGYEPVVFERNDAAVEGGLAIGIHLNGQRVLSKIPGLLETIGGLTRDEWRCYSVVEEDKGVLAISDYPRRFRERDGAAPVAVHRGVMQKRSIDFAQKLGVEMNWGHNLRALEQTDTDVTLTFENGVRETFDFVVGCDGLHSRTRSCIFGEQPAEYTGLAQWAGLSPIPELYRGKPCGADIYGAGPSMLIIQIDEDTMMWAITQREPEAKESWKAIDQAAMDDFKNNSPFSKWDFGGGELIKTSRMIARYGLYDRPELKCWHKGRVVLLGDAAHPTSPHIGQGANQAFEDIDMLVSLLEKYNPDAGSPSTATLDTLFTEFEQARIPRTSMLVKRAREMGEVRAVKGVEAAIARNNWCRKLAAEDKLHERFLVE